MIMDIKIDTKIANRNAQIRNDKLNYLLSQITSEPKTVACPSCARVFEVNDPVADWTQNVGFCPICDDSLNAEVDYDNE